MNRFQQMASRVIDGHFGSLKKPFVIKHSGGWDYQNQSDKSPTTTTTTALKINLNKSQYQTQDVQLGDFILEFTDDIQINVDSDSGIYDGVEITFVSVLSHAGDAAQRIVARVK